DRRAHGGRAARAHGRRLRRRRRRRDRREGCGRDRPAVGGDRRPAAVGLQAGRGAAHGQAGVRRRRRCRNHHPQGATVRAALNRPGATPRRPDRKPMATSSSISRQQAAGNAHGQGNAGLAGLVVGAIGVVFGDIGTSPLYTIKQAFSPHYGLTANHDTVLGVLSLVFWSLTMVVTVKYVTIIMRADNEGEGGIMALMTLAQRTLRKGSRAAYVVGILGIFGASLFFGDGVITPAISVLSAVEGLEVVAPQLHAWIVPIVVVVLVTVFMAQRFGTEKVGKVFGPVMVMWFAALAVLGVLNILHAPEVLKAINPWWALHFFYVHHFHGIFILGAVVLAVTGGEALYTDMGHFGARPIRHAWYYFVLPALMLNYLGQGALVLEHPEAIQNPFYVGVPEWARWPMIILATGATVIASQAVITGAFSISRQAMQLGYIPRMAIKHTSSETIGQIYIPGI